MGSDAHLILIGADSELADSLVERLEELEQSWSRFIPESELSRLNAGTGAPTVVSVALSMTGGSTCAPPVSVASEVVVVDSLSTASLSLLLHAAGASMRREAAIVAAKIRFEVVIALSLSRPRIPT